MVPCAWPPRALLLDSQMMDATSAPPSDTESTAASSLPGRSSPSASTLCQGEEASLRSAGGRGASSSRAAVGGMRSRRQKVVVPGSPQASTGNTTSAPSAPSSKGGSRRVSRHSVDDDAAPVIDLRPSKDIKHTRCTSEKELAKEFDSIHRILSDQRGDWKQRMGALKKLQSYVLGSAQVDYFLPLALRLREPVIAQVQDLRSAICREACSVLFMLVHALGADFEPFAVAALPVLFRITFVTIQVISESAYQSIRAIVRECRTQRVLGTLVEQLNNRNGTLRWRCTQSLLLALRTYPVHVLERHVEAVDSAIRQCLEDARDDVRAVGRQCFWAFREVFEERGARLFARLDGTKQRLLDSEKPSPRCSEADGSREELIDEQSGNEEEDVLQATNRLTITTQEVKTSQPPSNPDTPNRKSSGRSPNVLLSPNRRLSARSAHREGSLPARTGEAKPSAEASAAASGPSTPVPASAARAASPVPSPPLPSQGASPSCSSPMARVSSGATDGKVCDGVPATSPTRIPTPALSVSDSFPHRREMPPKRLSTGPDCDRAPSAPPSPPTTFAHPERLSSRSTDSNFQPPARPAPAGPTSLAQAALGATAAQQPQQRQQSRQQQPQQAPPAQQTPQTQQAPQAHQTPQAQQTPQTPQTQPTQQAQQTQHAPLTPQSQQLQQVHERTRPQQRQQQPQPQPQSQQQQRRQSQEVPQPVLQQRQHQKAVSTDQPEAATLAAVAAASMGPSAVSRGTSRTAASGGSPSSPTSGGAKGSSPAAPKGTPKSTAASPSAPRVNATPPPTDAAGAADLMQCAPARLCRLASAPGAPAQRAAALAALAERLRLAGKGGSAGALDDAIPSVEDILAAVLDRLTDAGPVATAAISALRALLASRPALCTPHLDIILTALLGAGYGQRSPSSDSIRSCLDLLIENQEPAALVTSLGSLLAGDCIVEGTPINEPTRLAALDLLEKHAAEATRVCDYLAGRNGGLCDASTGVGDCSSMRGLVEDLLRCSSTWPPASAECPPASSAIRRATARALHALFLRETHAFLAASAVLHPAPREALCALLAHLVPELSESLSCLAEAGGRGRSNSTTVASVGLQDVAPPVRLTRAPWPCSSSISGAEAKAKVQVVTTMGNSDSSRQAPGPDVGKSTVTSAPEQVSPHQNISNLLAQCSASTIRATLRSLALASRTESSEVWEKHFGRVLILILDSLTQRDGQGVRDLALLCLQELVTHQASFFTDFAEVVASKLFDTYRNCSQTDKQMIASIDRTLERLIGIIEPTRALEILLPVISTEGVPLLQSATRLLSSVLHRMSPKAVLDHLDIVLPGMVTAFGNPSSEVRKAAVFCLVDIYMILGEQVMPRLVRDLTPSQMKLVTIYIGRQQREREELGLDENLN